MFSVKQYLLFIPLEIFKVVLAVLNTDPPRFGPYFLKLQNFRLFLPCLHMYYICSSQILKSSKVIAKKTEKHPLAPPKIVPDSSTSEHCSKGLAFHHI